MIIAVSISKEKGCGSVSDICECLGQTRDAYYKYKRRQANEIESFEKVVDMVNERRIDQPREGARKLHEALRVNFELEGLKNRPR